MFVLELILHAINNELEVMERLTHIDVLEMLIKLLIGTLNSLLLVYQSLFKTFFWVYFIYFVWGVP